MAGQMISYPDNKVWEKSDFLRVSFPINNHQYLNFNKYKQLRSDPMVQL